MVTVIIIYLLNLKNQESFNGGKYAEAHVTCMLYLWQNETVLVRLPDYISDTGSKADDVKNRSPWAFPYVCFCLEVLNEAYRVAHHNIKKLKQVRIHRPSPTAYLTCDSGFNDAECRSIQPGNIKTSPQSLPEGLTKVQAF